MDTGHHDSQVASLLGGFGRSRGDHDPVCLRRSKGLSLVAYPIIQRGE